MDFVLMISVDIILAIYVFLLIACLPLCIFYILSNAIRCFIEYKKIRWDSENIDIE